MPSESNLFTSIKFTLGKKTWVEGKEYIPHCASPSISGKFSLISLKSGSKEDWDLAKDIQGKFILITLDKPIEMKNESEVLKQKAFMQADSQIVRAFKAGAKGVIFLKTKLTFSFAPEQLPIPVLEVLESVWNQITNEKIIKKKNCIQLEIKSEVKNIESQNVIASSENCEFKDTAIVICAHYDHLGKLGNAIFYGANDNGSGTSFLLTFAQQMTKIKTKYRLIFIAFGAEETGLNGSIYYALKNPCFPLENTKLVLNFDLMGNGEEGMMVVGGETFKDWYNQIKIINTEKGYLEPLKSRANAANSDHYPFTVKKVPGLFFYTMGGAPHYHDVNDKPDQIKFPILYNTQKLIAQFLIKL